MDTKKRIIEESLKLFSEKGYDEVSVEEIAQAVGIKAPSLYKHYKGKKSIFEAVIDEMNSKYNERVASMQMNGSDAKSDLNLFNGITLEQLMAIGINLMEFYIHDIYVQRFRKMLTIGQYQNKELAQILNMQYIDGPLMYQQELFGMLMDAGLMRKSNPKTAATMFYAPIYLLINMCDNNPDREKEAMAAVKEHIEEFHKSYNMEVE